MKTIKATVTPSVTACGRSLYAGARSRMLPLSLVLVTSVLGCGGPNYPDGSLLESGVDAQFVGSDGGTCMPNLDGIISDDELPVALNVPVHYLVSRTPQAVNLLGRVEDGQRIWDMSAVQADDQAFELMASELGEAWFSERLDQQADLYLVPLDLSGELQGILQRQTGVLRTLGSASTEQAPTQGQTWLLYDPPLDVFRLPLQLGQNWSTDSEISNAVVQGLPVAAQLNHQVEVVAEGRLVLPDVTFDRVLQVVTHYHQQALTGSASDWVQVSYMTECYGEVARVTSPLGVTENFFSTAREVRRLGF